MPLTSESVDVTSLPSSYTTTHIKWLKNHQTSIQLFLSVPCDAVLFHGVSLCSKVIHVTVTPLRHAAGTPWCSLTLLIMWWMLRLPVALSLWMTDSSQVCGSAWLFLQRSEIEMKGETPTGSLITPRAVNLNRTWREERDCLRFTLCFNVLNVLSVAGSFRETSAKTEKLKFEIKV